MDKSYNNWEDLTFYLRERYNLADSVNSILFFIGIHESGLGFRKFNLEEKTSLILLGQKTVTNLFPTFNMNNATNEITDSNFSSESSDQYKKQLKEAILQYFNTHK